MARGDLVVVGTFLVLWGKVAAMDGGMETAAAIEAGRIPFVIAQSAALLGAITAIFLIDRVHRLTALACCMGLAVIGAFSVAGAMDILIMSGAGGALFDAVDPRAPFIVLGIMNLVVMGSAIYVRRVNPGKAYLSQAA